MFCRCFCTVRALMRRIAPICASLLPAATQRSTSASRAVSWPTVLILIDPGEVRTQHVEQRALAVGEVAPRAVQHEAHEQAVAHVDRQRDRVVDADAAVVVVVERGAAELLERHRVADALRHAPPW